MDNLQVVFDYHVRTKHHFQRFAASLGYLDWATQPDPFRRFEGTPLHPLSQSGVEQGASYDDLFRPGAIAVQPVNHTTISALFEFSLALSAWKEFQGSRWALRINPSSGNLHPTEGYLVAGSIEGLHDHAAVYHYAPKEHALERRCEFPHAAVAVLPVDAILVGLTSIHWRESWKYGERAFRYCQHDVGHALAAVTFSAAMLGWTARCGGCHDSDAARTRPRRRFFRCRGRTPRSAPDRLSQGPRGRSATDRPSKRRRDESLARSRQRAQPRTCRLARHRRGHTGDSQVRCDITRRLPRGESSGDRYHASLHVREVDHPSTTKRGCV